MLHHIPLAEIDDAALTRDRTQLDEAALTELRLSIARSGLRMPIEVFPLPEPALPEPALPEEPRADQEPRPRWGLISGYRRLMAVRALHELTGDERHATIAALVREPGTLATALAEMVEENEVRESLSPWERGRIALLARDQGIFPTIEEAVDRLYPSADYAKKSRIRSLARLVEALEGELTDPESLSQRQALRLANAVRDGFGPVIRTALTESTLTDAATQWTLIESILLESETTRTEVAPPRKDRPRRVLSPRRGLTIRREVVTGGYLLRFTGPDATSGLMDTVMDEIERMFSPE